MTKPPVFLDANIFMYAAGQPHPYKEACVRILSDVETGKITTVVNTEILQELLYRYTHIGLADKGVQLCRYILKLPLTVLPVTVAELHLAIELFEQHRQAGLTPRDAIHAATLHQNGLNQLLSADKDFDHLNFLQRIDPLDYKG